MIGFRRHLLLASAGCAATAWTHSTKPQSEMAIDQYECEKESLSMYPQILKKDPSAFDGHKDLNERQRQGAWDRCLQARG